MEDQWYVGRKGQRSGPYTTGQLKQMAAAGQLVHSDLLWKQGLEQWVPLTKVKGLLPVNAAGTLPPLELQRQEPRVSEPRVSETRARHSEPADAFNFSTAAAPARSADTGRNPYATGTATPVGSTSGASPAVYAAFLPRVGAALLDGLFMIVLALTLQVGVPVLCSVLLGMQEAGLGAAVMLGWLGTICLSILYYVGYEASAKQGTWGKQALGIKVADMQGRRITIGRALGRFFAKLLSNMTGGIGYMLPLFTKRKQTLHDMICGCLALKK
ncbi:MAG: RDD family protein [Planctomycetia bacterium]|jgi:uncharacterized RDD family membrane protein YckC